MEEKQWLDGSTLREWAQLEFKRQSNLIDLQFQVEWLYILSISMLMKKNFIIYLRLSISLMLNKKKLKVHSMKESSQGFSLKTTSLLVLRAMKFIVWTFINLIKAIIFFWMIQLITLEVKSMDKKCSTCSFFKGHKMPKIVKIMLSKLLMKLATLEEYHTWIIVFSSFIETKRTTM
jgi:hypothetical protein